MDLVILMPKYQRLVIGRAFGINLNSCLVPMSLRRVQTIEELLPWLHLKGILTGDFTDEIAAFKLMHTAQKQWYELWGYNLLANVVEGVLFKDRIRVDQKVA
jgi:hypothetical protein